MGIKKGYKILKVWHMCWQDVYVQTLWYYNLLSITADSEILGRGLKNSNPFLKRLYYLMLFNMLI
jgi:hypothetical protein